MNIAVVSWTVILFAVAVQVFRKSSPDLRIYFWPALFMKLIAGLVLGALYAFYYRHGDTLLYFEHGRLIAAMAQDDIGGYVKFLRTSVVPPGMDVILERQPERALFFSKLVSVVALATGGSYWIMSMVLSFLSFLGSWGITHSVASRLPAFRHAAAFAFLLVPSTVFWTSGLIKEAVAMPALYGVVIVFLTISTTGKITPGNVLLFAACGWIVYMLKYYYLAVLFPILLATGLAIAWQRRKPAAPAVYALRWMAVLVVPLSLAPLIHPNFYPERFLHVIADNYAAFRELSEPGDAIDYGSVEPTFASIASRVPAAVAAGLFRPFIFECQNSLQRVLAMENTVVLVLAVAALLGRFRKGRSPAGVFLLPVLAYVLLLAGFLALSTPNFGTLSRYRVGFYPFFVLLIAGSNPLLAPLWRRLERLNASLFLNGERG